jgi:hypothetical protein
VGSPACEVPMPLLVRNRRERLFRLVISLVTLPMFNRAGSDSGRILVHSHICNSCELGFHLTNDNLHPYPSTALSVSQLAKTTTQHKQCYSTSEITVKFGVARNDEKHRWCAQFSGQCVRRNDFGSSRQHYLARVNVVYPSWQSFIASCNCVGSLRRVRE